MSLCASALLALRLPSALRRRDVGSLALRASTLLALLLWCVPGAPAEEPWTLDPARLLPEQAHARPVFVFVTAAWSRVARRFEQEVLAAPEVRAELARSFLCTRLESPVPEDLAARFRITRVPAFVFLDRHGGWLRTIEGEHPADMFARVLATQAADAAEQEGAISEALSLDVPDLPELLRRTRLLVEQGLASRAIAHLERLAELDPRDEQYAGLWAATERARIAYRAGDIAGGDGWRERAAALELDRGGALVAVGLRRERARALRLGRRFADARAELHALRGEALADEEIESLGLDEAALLRDEGRDAEALTRLQAVWDTARGPARAAAEAELERWAFAADAADTTAERTRQTWLTMRDGRDLVRLFGCAECHSIEPAVAVEDPASCVGCHRKIVDTASKPRELAAALRSDPEWYSHTRNIRHYLYAPNLGTVGARLSRDWMRGFLRRPVDVRPFLEESMPRLPLDDAQIELALDYLEALAARRVGKVEAEALPPGDRAHGEALFVEKGCQACHVFGNRTFPGGPPAEPWPRLAPENIRHAPNLRWARARLRPEAVVAWIREPARFVPGTLMPAHPFAPQEMADLVAFLLEGDLGAAAKLAAAPALAEPRPGEVRFEELAEIFHDTCKHCHLPDEKGGIGNTGGGWGYRPRGLDLDTESGPLRGSYGMGGRRKPIFRAGAGEALPPILQRVLWRLDENRYDAWPPYRDPLIPLPAERYDHPPGMPLGLPALTAEEVATLRGWIRDRAGK